MRKKIGKEIYWSYLRLVPPPPVVMPRWFNAGTRAILIQMTFYNTNTKQLTNLRLLFEVFFSGQFLNSYQFDTAKIVVYQSKTDQVRSAQEIVAEPCVCLRLLDPPPQCGCGHKGVVFVTVVSLPPPHVPVHPAASRMLGVMYSQRRCHGGGGGPLSWLSVSCLPSP